MEHLSADVLVAGAGIAGICAAVSAARHGSTVILLCDRPVPGGNASTEVKVGMSGAGHSGYLGFNMNPGFYVKETGIVDELRQRALYYNEGGGYNGWALWDAVYFDTLYAEPNLRLMLNTACVDCDVDEGRITRVRARNCNSDAEYVICAKLFVDATGHAMLAARAGADWAMGRESKAEYGERWAPEAADRYTMGNTFLFRTEDVGHEVSFRAPEFAYKMEELGLPDSEGFTNPRCFRTLSCTGADWTYEYGGQLDTIRDTEEIDLELRRITFGIWDYVKNSGRYPAAKNRVLCEVCCRSGTRESRRILGDLVLTENDVENKVDWPDSVAFGGWPMDVHAPLGIYDPLPASNFIPVTGPYNIPFRSLYSRNVGNLLLAGRDISVSHVALGSTRVMATCGVIGQAVGTAAALCLEKGLLPRELLPEIGTLQRLLLDDGCMIYHRRDPGLCAFDAQATDEREYACTERTGELRLTREYGLALMTETRRIDSAEIFVSETLGADTLLRFRIFTGEHPETFLPSVSLGERELRVPAGFRGWLRLPVDAEPGADKKLYLVFTANPALSLAAGSGRCPGAMTMLLHSRTNHEGMDHDSVPLSEEKTGYIAFDHYTLHTSNLLFRNVLPDQRLFSADKAVNGWPRPYGGMNEWIPAGALPQTLTLTPRVLTAADRVSVSFDNALEYDHHRAMMPCMVKSYVLTVETDGGTLTFADEHNWRRLVVFPLENRTVRRLTLTLRESYGDVPGVFSVKLL